MEETFNDRESRRILRGSILRAANDAWLSGRINFLQILYIAVGRDATREDRRKVQEEIKYLVNEGYLKGNGPRDAVDNDPSDYFELTNDGRKLFTGDRKDDTVLI